MPRAIEWLKENLDMDLAQWVDALNIENPDLETWVVETAETSAPDGVEIESITLTCSDIGINENTGIITAVIISEAQLGGCPDHLLDDLSDFGSGALEIQCNIKNPLLIC